jgi:hypothetical protein
MEREANRPPVFHLMRSPQRDQGMTNAPPMTYQGRTNVEARMTKTIPTRIGAVDTRGTAIRFDTDAGPFQLLLDLPGDVL